MCPSLRSGQGSTPNFRQILILCSLARLPAVVVRRDGKSPLDLNADSKNKKANIVEVNVRIARTPHCFLRLGGWAGNKYIEILEVFR
jgi:hypothetical protein